jgi:transcriptional regulator GlxA family with amidase domain
VLAQSGERVDAMRVHLGYALFELMALFRELVASFTALVSNPGRGCRSLRLEQARHFVEARYAEPLTLAQVAKEAGFSSSRFSRLFKAAVGTGFAAYLLQVRLDKSAGLLRSSRLPIHQVAQECGFGSASYFIQAFKRAYQTTPQAFRESSARQ